MKPLRNGDQLTAYACRHPDGSMKNPDGRTRKAAFCPDCQFKYREKGCIFTPTSSGGQAFGRNDSAKPQPQHTGPRPTNNSTGGRWNKEDILEVIVEYYERHGEWPENTTAFRDSKRLPHSQTVERYFGSIEEAVKQAKALLLEQGKEIPDLTNIP